MSLVTVQTRRLLRALTDLADTVLCAHRSAAFAGAVTHAAADLAAGELAGGSLIWGPVVTPSPEDAGPLTRMFVAKRGGDAAPVEYVVVVASAEPIAPTAADGRPAPRVPWPAGGKIYESVHYGLLDLLEMVDPETGEALLALLEARTAAGPARVWVTGVGAGGALASALALFLRDNEPEWNPRRTAVVTALSFEASAAGDARFCAHAVQAFSAPIPAPEPKVARAASRTRRGFGAALVPVPPDGPSH